MSIRFQRTPLILALILLVAAGALFYFVGAYAALLSAGGGMLMLAISMIAGGKSTVDAAPVTEDDLTPTASFGPAAAAAGVSEPLTRADKRAAKKAEAEAKKRAAEEAKFAKKAQAEAVKAEKAAAAEAKKAEKAAAAEAKKAEKAAAAEAKKAEKGDKKGRKVRAAEEDADAEEWISELQQMNAQQHAAAPGSPFGWAVESGIAADADATQRKVSFDDTTDIPVIPVVEPAAAAGIAAAAASYLAPPPPEALPVMGESSHEQWALDAYRDPSFVPPFTDGTPAPQAHTTDVDMVDETDGTIIADVEVIPGQEDDLTHGMPEMPAIMDQELLDLPAEVDAVFADDDSVDVSNPATALKRMADRFQDVAADISREWEHMAQVYEQRDQLLAALKQATAENAALKAEMTKAIEAGSTEEIEALSSSLDDARTEVTRLYEENRELSRLRYTSSQTVSRLREVRFLLVSDPHHDPDLLAAIDEAIRDSE